METKTCTKCGETKTEEEFPKDKSKKSGLKSSCKLCNIVYSKAWRKDNPEKAKETVKLYRQRNPHKEKEFRQTRYKNNKEKIKACARKFREEHRESVNEKDRERGRKRRMSRPDLEKRYQKNYYARSRDRKLASNRALRIKRERCVPAWLSPEQLEEIKKFYWLAKDLQVITGEVYQVDHIVPLQGKTVCGLHVPWNLQVLPRDINIRKANKLEV